MQIPIKLMAQRRAGDINRSQCRSASVFEVDGVLDAVARRVAGDAVGV